MEPVPQRLTVNGIELATWTWPGDRLPLLLVHGLASNARLWDVMAIHLAAAGFGVTSLDLRGHGRSDRPADGYDFATLCGDLRQVIGQLGIAPVVAIGQSFGGNLCLELAATHPQLVSSLVLIDGGFIDLSVTFSDWATAATALTPPPLPPVDYATAAREAKNRFAGFSDQAVAAQLANLEAGEDGLVRRRLPLAAHMDILRHLYRHRPVERASLVSQPVFVLAADNHDHPDKAERVAALVDALPYAAAHWISGHHDLHAQEPETVAKLIIQAIEEGFLS